MHGPASAAVHATPLEHAGSTKRTVRTRSVYVGGMVEHQDRSGNKGQGGSDSREPVGMQGSASTIA